MLVNPTLDKLHALRLIGMAKAYTEQEGMPDIGTLSFDQRFGLLVDNEMTDRQNRSLISRLRYARL
ncbi:MAG: ATP-binding protein, partial [Deltaproteobacteria bacterium]|nr:ATP-binding protein [Deltaproteobacteria bacterium]